MINAARKVASSEGPVLATTPLATGPPVLLCVILAAAGLAGLPLSATRTHVPAVGR